jgi:hypothetical protein
MFLVKVLVGADISLFSLLCLDVILTFISCMSFVDDLFISWHCGVSNGIGTGIS